MEKNKIILIAVVAIVLIGGGIFLLTGSDEANNNNILPTDQSGNEQVNATTTATTTTTTQKTTTTKPTTPTSYPTITKDGIYLVYYTATGFSPKTLTIPAGKSVRFVNKTTSGMLVYAIDYLYNQSHAGLNQSKTVGKDGIHNYTFTLKGVWSYQNELNKLHQATVIVE